MRTINIFGCWRAIDHYWRWTSGGAAASQYNIVGGVATIVGVSMTQCGPGIGWGHCSAISPIYLITRGILAGVGDCSTGRGVDAGGIGSKRRYRNWCIQQDIIGFVCIIH